MARVKKTEIQNEIVEQEGVDTPHAELFADVEIAAPETEPVTDLSDVQDITAGNQSFNEETVYEVLKTFTIIIGNGAVEGEVGKRIKISKAEEGVIRTLLADGYVKIIK